MIELCKQWLKIGAKAINYNKEFPAITNEDVHTRHTETFNDVATRTSEVDQSTMLMRILI